MSVYRKNTLVVDFSVLPKRPDAGKVQEFLEKKVKLQLEDTKTIQLHNLRNCVYIETVDCDTALRYEKDNNYQHTIVCNGKEFKIPVYVESEAVTVRVHDLPSHTEHVAVINFMKQYGVVLSISRERWKHHFPGYFNGVRVLRMKLSRQIPSVIVINGDATLVSYRGQPKTCHHCGEAAHPKQKCTKTTTAASNLQTLPQVAPTGSSEPQLNTTEFPLLTPPADDEESSNNLDSTATKADGKIEVKQNENSTTKTSGDDNDYDDDDDSSDTNDFVEPNNQKRRMSRRERKANEEKKVCRSQGSQKLSQNSNRFQELVEIDSMSVGAEAMEDYVVRVKDRNRKSKTSI